MASQYAGWAVKTDSYFAMGSGPARSVFANEDLIKELGYKDSSKTAVLCLESRKLPDEKTALWLAERCGVSPENLYILIAPTASPAGSVQIAARSVETGLHKLHELGYNLGNIESGWGIAPVPPVAKDDMVALGRTNDAILYGTTVHYTLEDEDANLEGLLPKVPSKESRDYGAPFAEIFAKYNHNFYDIDPLLFSPAKVILTNRKSGKSFSAGEIREDLLRKSFEI
jgi:methenyltetrahydromethanopterin cyclohydrolase